MKKIYFSLLFISVITIAKAQAPTCSLNPTFIASNKNGVYPDSATNLMSGTVNQPYVQNLTVKVPLDTVQSPFKFCFNRVVLSTPTTAVNYNLPPGLNFGSSTAAVANGTVNGAISLKFPGNANNCASIFGTPTTVGTYTLKLMTETYATLTGGTCPANPTVSGGTKLNTTVLGYYIITILPPAGVNEIVNEKSFNLKNQPNPFTGKTIIKFNVKDVDALQIKICDILGKTIFTDAIKTKFGENNYEFDGSKLNDGIYFYTISYKNYSETKRMIIASN